MYNVKRIIITIIYQCNYYKTNINKQDYYYLYIAK